MFLKTFLASIPILYPLKTLGNLWEILRLSKCGVFSGPDFPVFTPIAGKNGLEENSVFRHFSSSATECLVIYF